MSFFFGRIQESDYYVARSRLSCHFATANTGAQLRPRQGCKGLRKQLDSLDSPYIFALIKTKNNYFGRAHQASCYIPIARFFLLSGARVCHNQELGR